jgi:hypothetical protein
LISVPVQSSQYVRGSPPATCRNQPRTRHPR